MDGIIPVYKEKGFTSFDVIAVMRGITSVRKIGHSGTLDPMAEGVLPVFIGNATKAVDFLPDDSKGYDAGFQLGITTDTEDITGAVLKTVSCNVLREEIEEKLKLFKGEITQIPPMYSAVSVDGQRMYDLARKGVVIERPPRKITIDKIQLTEYAENKGRLLVSCSKGTYIRTLISDLGNVLFVGGAMTDLLRTRAGVFTLEDCRKLSELKQMSKEEISKIALPVDVLYKDLPRAMLDDFQTEIFKNGAVLDLDRIKFTSDMENPFGIAIISNDLKLIGLGKAENSNLIAFRRFLR